MDLVPWTLFLAETNWAERYAKLFNQADTWASMFESSLIVNQKQAADNMLHEKERRRGNLQSKKL